MFIFSFLDQKKIQNLMREGEKKHLRKTTGKVNEDYQIKNEMK